MKRPEDWSDHICRVVPFADEHGARIDISNRVADGVVQGAQVSLSFALAA